MADAAMTPPRLFQSATHWIWLLVLLLAALLFPLPLYLISLAVFGLPHIVWELGFLRSRYAARWPRWWWLALWLILLCNAGVRGAFWLNACSADTTQAVDILALFLLATIVVCAPAHTGWRARLAGLAVALLMWWLLQQGNVVTALLILALAHNFTPTLLAWDLARTDPTAKRLAWQVSGLFLLPIALACSGWNGIALLTTNTHYLSFLDGQFPAAWLPNDRPALWSAVVLAQCLHYFCVIRILPAAQMHRSGIPVLTRTEKTCTAMIVALILLYYLFDFASARKLYAVAAGVHAWLEWPVLLMALLSMSGNSTKTIESIQSKHDEQLAEPISFVLER